MVALQRPVIEGCGFNQLIALYSDIHANMPAFEACLAASAALGIKRHVILGDLVGYGPDLLQLWSNAWPPWQKKVQLCCAAIMMRQQLAPTPA